jgi:choline-sulfatase
MLRKITCTTFLLVTIFYVTGQQRPNFVFIFSDDQTYLSIGQLNNAEIETPHLDQLISQGTTFTHAFNQGGWQGAICVASRTMLNTGNFLWKAAHYDNSVNADLRSKEPPFMVKEDKLANYWSTLFRKSGYTTFFTGKWHVHSPVDQLFDTVNHVRGGMPNQTPKRYERSFNPEEQDNWSPFDTTNEGYWKGGEHWSEVVSDDAIQFLESVSSGEKPIFMYIAFNAPHDPRQSPEEFVKRYQPGKIKIPPNFIPEYPYNEAAASGRTLRDERLAPFPRNEWAVRVNRQEYYAIISHMDYQIGRILEALKRSGKYDNTYIIFTSDHGLAVGDHGFMGKQNMYDASIRVPMIITGPAIPENQIKDDLVYLQDVMPTSLELAQIDIPESVDFKSLVPIINNTVGARGYNAVYGAYIHSQRMIRNSHYKMILYPKINRVRLYDLKNDPYEMNDLSGNKKFKNKILELFKEFEKLQVKTGDPLDISATIQHFEQTH